MRVLVALSWLALILGPEVLLSQESPAALTVMKYLPLLPRKD